MSPSSQQGTTSTSSVTRLGGELHVVRTLKDDAGNLVHSVVTPLMVEFTLRDVVQILIGASVLCIPAAYTEEVWQLGTHLPLRNTIGIVALSFLFLSFFGYFIFSRGHLRGNEREFVMRICCAYMITFAVSASILLLVEKFPIVSDPATAIKRAVLVSFPGCFSATVVDSLK
jgi:uncharacterized membrane protein